MKIDIFSELQQPRPWADDHEHTLILETMEQAKLADQCGYGVWWEVEHHGAAEFSYSSAPEVMLSAIAQQTSRLRLGQSAALSPFRFNHPIRVAERAAFLDHLSDGRVELGLARSTTPEWRLFNIDPEETRSQMQQAFEMIPQMWTTDSFSFESEHFQIRNANIIPKPYQQPHPPLWQACSSAASFEQAGRNGVGALGVTLWAPPSQVREWIGIYRKAIAECTKPVGKFINNQVAFFTFVHVADSDEEAARNGAASAAAWYTNGSFTFFETKKKFLESAEQLNAQAKDEAGTGLVGQLSAQQNEAQSTSRAQQAIARVMKGEEVPDQELYDVLAEQDSLIVGGKDTVRKKIAVYEEMGIDRLMSFHQVGRLEHDKIMKSIGLLGELIPELDRS